MSMGECFGDEGDRRPAGEHVQAPGARLGIWAHVQANTVKHRSMHGDCRTASHVSANYKTWFKNQWSGFAIDEIEI